MAIDPVSSVVAVLLVAYLGFSVWNAYSAGCNKGLLRKHKVKGIIQIGPHLSLAVSFAGVMLVAFLSMELVAYYTGFLKINLSAGLANLDFFEFLIQQFMSINLHYVRYVEFLVLSIVLAATVAYVIVELAYHKGLRKTHPKPGPRASAHKTK